MDGGTLGVVGVVFSLLAARPLDWEVGDARKCLLIAVAHPALGIVLRSFAILEGERGWVVAGQFATAVALLLYFLAVLDFQRVDVPA